MHYLFSDLDGTLVYSHRRVPSGECIAAEHLNGRIQSYMTQRTYDFLAHAEGLMLIPLTSRTVDQYMRLSECFAGLGCGFALVCNGGILLRDNVADPQWLEETVENARAELPKLHAAVELLRRLLPAEQVCSVDDVMAYAKTADPAALEKEMIRVLGSTGINIYSDNRKVYCFPASINKGTAVHRFMRRMGIEGAIAAGDGVQDVSMLNAADIAILPRTLSDRVHAAKCFVADDERCLSDYICEVLTYSTLTP